MKFRFGAGDIMSAYEVVTFPRQLAGEWRLFTVYVVKNSDIPFLWSRKGMAKAKVIIDLAEEVITVLGKRIVTNIISSGHMCISILLTEDS